MYIVYEENEIEQLQSKYLLLEMDTIEISNDKTITAHCVLSTDHITLQEIGSITSLENLHKQLMENYKLQKWDCCEDAISHLQGKFKGEMDSFYDELSERINTFKDEGTASSWSPVISKKND